MSTATNKTTTKTDTRMQNNKETQKIRVKKFLINFQRDAPPETAGVDIEKCVNESI